ncbi:expressed protein [Echinococcus multilocularis]|uniref:Expressed protein n=1 Tax=Echinococcus multilocularis TaxID=6211 RepID=A0A087VXU6_ECHMU|nr:expressed protein [Echinococcus multilocularis]
MSVWDHFFPSSFAFLCECSFFCILLTSGGRKTLSLKYCTHFRFSTHKRMSFPTSFRPSSPHPHRHTHTSIFTGIKTFFFMCIQNPFKAFVSYIHIYNDSLGNSFFLLLELSCWRTLP